MVNLDSVPQVKLVDEGQIIDEIPECRHFSPLRHGNRAGCESRCSAFSHDEKYFAWSLGHGFVRIILFTKTSTPDITLNDLIDSTHAESTGNRLRRIDCAKPVLAMEFGNSCCGTDNCIPYMLATGLENGRIKVWNATSGDMIYCLSDHGSDVNGLAFCNIAGDLLISCSDDKTLKVWDLSDGGNMTLTINCHQRAVLDCKVCPSNPSLVCSVGRGKSVVIWVLHHKRSFSRCRNLHGHLNDVVSCSWSPDGALLATASHDATVIVWDPEIAQKILMIGHKNPLPEAIYAGGSNGAWLRCVDFSPDGSRIATVCEDNKTRIWSVKSSAPPLMRTMDKPGFGCRFSPSGTALALGNADGSTSILEVEVSVMSLRHLSRMSVRRVLSSSDVHSLGLPSFIESYLLYRIL